MIEAEIILQIRQTQQGEPAEVGNGSLCAASYIRLHLIKNLFRIFNVSFYIAVFPIIIEIS